MLPLVYIIVDLEVLLEDVLLNTAADTLLATLLRLSTANKCSVLKVALVSRRNATRRAFLPANAHALDIDKVLGSAAKTSHPVMHRVAGRGFSGRGVAAFESRLLTRASDIARSSE
jgi:hypothetical protein